MKNKLDVFKANIEDFDNIHKSFNRLYNRNKELPTNFFNETDKANMDMCMMRNNNINHALMKMILGTLNHEED